jgi:hypothetical protein
VKRNLLCLCAALAAGCSTASKDIMPTYASPTPYEGYSCEQIAAESERLDSRTRALAGRLDEAARNDKGIVLMSALFFPPALFALGGTKEEEAEYARLKGEREALRQTGAAKGCASTLAAQSPPLF